MYKSSNLFTAVLSTIVILFFVNGSVSAQEDLDKIPLPVGGISAISKNILYPIGLIISIFTI